MSFACRPLHGFNTDKVVFTSATASDLKGVTLAVAASVTFNTNGSMSSTGNASSVPAGWWSSIGGVPGNTVWVKFVSSPTAWNTGGLVSGTIYQLSSALTIGWSSGAGTTKTGSAAVTFYADSGGTQVIGSGTINGDVESA